MWKCRLCNESNRVAVFRSPFWSQLCSGMFRSPFTYSWHRISPFGCRIPTWHDVLVDRRSCLVENSMVLAGVRLQFMFAGGTCLHVAKWP